MYVRVEVACSQFAREAIGKSVARDQRQNVKCFMRLVAQLRLLNIMRLLAAVSHTSCIRYVQLATVLAFLGGDQGSYVLSKVDATTTI